jgi:hypothetical protein
MRHQQQYYQTPDGKFRADAGYGFTPTFSEFLPWYYSPFILIPFLVLSYAVVIYLFGIGVFIIYFVGLPVAILIYRETLPLRKLYTEDEIRSM